MTTITEERVRGRARRATTYKAATTILNETARYQPVKTYDVFLSHSVRDAEIVLGVKLILEDDGRSVYVDWIEDPQLDRSRVSPDTAEVLRGRMRSCESLIYIHTESSPGSKWMPWELGFFDGFKGAVAILPVTRSQERDFKGQEYLGIYPWIDEGALTTGRTALRVHRSLYEYRDFGGWVRAPMSFRKVA